ncbi:synaptotagmin-2-like [Lethenteron reissneri]|uniref:synaptotagmin-2-like n=1 Tax=Lethenteron reissneri TaxID=7753 RepID=UPI002AB69562|nr:synaptotagmin-2-like [Lethenteron reissneri]
MPPSAEASQDGLLIVVALVFPVSCVTVAAMCLYCDLRRWFTSSGANLDRTSSPEQKGSSSSSGSSIRVIQPDLKLSRSSSAVYLNRPSREDFERRFSMPAGDSLARVNVMQTNTSLLQSQMCYSSTDGSQYGSTNLLINSRRPSINSPLDPSQFNVDIYKQAQPLENVEESCPLGSINFCLLYEEELNILTVQIIQVRDLPAKEFGKPASFICTVSLLPDVSSLQSQVHHNTPNPIFMESFLFSVPLLELHRRTVLVKLFEVDRFSKKNIVGKIEQPLRDLLLDMKAPQHFLKKIKLCRNEEHGELSISLGYLPKAEKLTITVLQARNINAIQNGSQGLFVKLTVSVENEKYIKTKKIMQKQRDGGIEFNESVAFSYSSEQLAKTHLLFQVIQTSSGKQKVEVGRILFGKDSSEKILARWKVIMSGQPARAIWYKLSAPEVDPGSP